MTWGPNRVRLAREYSLEGSQVSSLSRLDLTKEENMLFFVCSEAAESKLVKLETSHTVILPPNGECSLVKVFGSNKPHWFIFQKQQELATEM